MRFSKILFSILLLFACCTVGVSQKVMKENIPDDLNDKILIVLKYRVDNSVTSPQAKANFEKKVSQFNKELEEVMLEYPFSYQIIEDRKTLNSPEHQGKYLIAYEPRGFCKHKNNNESALLYTFFIKDLDNEERKDLLEVYNAAVYDVGDIYKNIIKTVKKKYKSR